MRSAASIVLGGELFVVLFAALVARGLSDASGRAVLVVSLVVFGLIFAGLWVLALVQGHRVDLIRADRLRE